MTDLYDELREKMNLCDQAAKEIRSRGIDLATKESAYKQAAAKKILALRAEGVPVTIIGDLVRGDEIVSNTRFERDCAEVLYKSCLESLNVYKLACRLLEAQIDREWRG